MRPKKLIIAIAALAAGAAASVALTFPHVAGAWDWHSLPSGYIAGYYTTCYDDSGVNHEPTCGSIPTCDHISISSSAGSFTEADCVASFQNDLDAYIGRTVCTVNPGADPTLCSPTTTTAAAATTTTDAATTDAVTTTTTAVQTSAPAAASASAAAPATAAAPTTTSTETVTVTTIVEDPALAARVSTLEQEYAQLATRVTAIQDANAAAWQTFHDDLVAGMSAPAAALDARSAGLNALYLLAP